MQDLLNTNVSAEYTEELSAALANHEVEVTVALEQLNDLCNIHKTIVDAKGMNRNLAITVESICENTLDIEKYPLNSYTKDLTITNYNVALESIIETIGKILKAIWDSIKKFFSYIGKLLSSIFTNSSRQGKAIEALEKEITLVKKDTVLLLEHVPEASRGEFRELTGDKEYQSELDRIANGLTVELCHHTPISQALVDVSLFFKEFVKAAKARVEFVIHTTKELSNVNLEKEAILLDNIRNNLNHVYANTDNFIKVMEKVGTSEDRLHVPSEAVYPCNVIAAEIGTLCKIANKHIETPVTKSPPMSAIKRSILGNFQVDGFKLTGIKNEIDGFIAEMQKSYNVDVKVDKLDFAELSKTYHSLCIVSRRESLACEQFMSLAYRLICLRKSILEKELQSEKNIHALLKRKFNENGWKSK